MFLYMVLYKCFSTVVTKSFTTYPNSVMSFMDDPFPVFRMSSYTESYIHDKLKKELEADHVEVKVK